MLYSKEDAILITGAANGIGAATARTLAKHGVPLSLFDRDEAGLKALAEELSVTDVMITTGDASSEADVTNVVAATEARFGGISGAVVAAGMCGISAPIQDYPIELFDQIYNLNVRGSWLALQKLAPVMRKKSKGSIVLISSINGIRGFATFSPYAASKQAVSGMAKTAALDLASLGIRVNSVHPGLTDTQMMRDVEQDMGAENHAAVKDDFASIPAMKRYAHPDEIAKTIAFLLSDQASYTTGAQYVVDGGFTTGLAG